LGLISDSIGGGLISAAPHQPDSFNSWAPERKYCGHPDDKVPATVPCHVVVFFLKKLILKIRTISDQMGCHSDHVLTVVQVSRKNLSLYLSQLQWNGPGTMCSPVATWDHMLTIDLDRKCY
jgi:hypothetical protein